MKNKLAERWAVLLLICFIWGCAKNAAPNPVLRWQSNPYGKVYINTMYPVFYQNRVIVSQWLPPKTLQITALSCADGHPIWTWQDSSLLSGELYYNLKPQLIKQDLILPCNREIISINLSNGSLNWKSVQLSAGADYLESDGVYLYRTYLNTANNRYSLMKIDPSSGAHTTIMVDTFPNNCKADVRSPIMVQDGSKKPIIVFTSIAQNISTKKTSALLNWYDPKKQVMLQKDTIYPVNDAGDGVTKQPLVDLETNRMYLVANNHLVCVDLLKRSIVWRKVMPRDMLSSRPLLHEGSIYWAGEDGLLSSINASDGTIKWSSRISGTPSRLYIKDGYIYVVGGGDGLWHILNIQDGTPVKNISTPNSQFYPSLIWQRTLVVDPQNAQAILTDGKDFMMYGL